MSREQEIINKITNILPNSKYHLNNFFESDAEIILYNGKKLLFTIDEFSEEDFFRDEDPYSLGWNLATGTISDILASGGKPVFFGHSMMINSQRWDDSFIEMFSKGIADVLNHCGTGFIGGDTGQSDKWRYSGIAIGETEKPLTRKGAEIGDVIYMTGKVGAGNLEAALKLYSEKKFVGKLIKNYKLKLPLRLKESELISQFASSCIDSSDGVLNALNSISEINNVGFEINQLPYLKEGLLACKLLSKPSILLFIGQCGEYELIFTIKKENDEEFNMEAKKKKLIFSKIGNVVKNEKRILHSKNKYIDLKDFNLNARDYPDIRVYLEELINYAKNTERR